MRNQKMLLNTRMTLVTRTRLDQVFRGDMWNGMLCAWSVLRFDTITSLITWLWSKALHWFWKCAFMLRNYSTLCMEVSKPNGDIIGKVKMNGLRRTALLRKYSAIMCGELRIPAKTHSSGDTSRYGAPRHNIVECGDVINHVARHSLVWTARVTAWRRFTLEHCRIRWCH